MSDPINVCVIGAGAAGLCAVRHLAALPSKFRVVAYEQAAMAGGTWVYTETTGVDADGLPIHSSMYRNLRTNIPKEVMAFPDFPCDKNLPSFIGHEQVRKYLDDYVDYFNIKQHIKFSHLVDSVEPHPGDGGPMRWKVRVKPARSSNDQVEEKYFDAVIVCNGHPEPCQGQTVLVFGAGASGTDIALDIAPYADKVFLSHNHTPLKSPLPENVLQIRGISHISRKNITLGDGTNLQADMIIFCTGYHFKFPFFSDQNLVNIDEEETVTPLYKHLFHIKYPSLSFVGIPKKICPFPLFDCQIQFIAAVLSEKIHLPTEEEMLADMHREFKMRLDEGLPPRYAHTMRKKQWQYNDDLAKIGHFKKIPRVVQTLYEAVYENRWLNLTTYKDKQYQLVDDEHYTEIKHS